MQGAPPCQPAKAGKKSSISAKKSPNRCTNCAMARRTPALTGLQRLAALCGTLVAVACATTAAQARARRPSPRRHNSHRPAAGPPGSRRSPNSSLPGPRLRKTAAGAGHHAPRPSTAPRPGSRPSPPSRQMNANQPEFAKPVWSYLDRRVSARRIADAKVMLARYGDVLARIEAASGVPKEILVAIWGMETDYGADTGGFNLFAALATLAYDGPRADYARPEFLAALKLYAGAALSADAKWWRPGRAPSARPSSRPPLFSNTPPTATATARSICGVGARCAGLVGDAAGRAGLEDRRALGL